jgi:hypothetical protein
MIAAADRKTTFIDAFVASKMAFASWTTDVSVTGSSAVLDALLIQASKEAGIVFDRKVALEQSGAIK